jgi:1,4-dihydroxy-2-naphthoate octaprenyltransferase
MAVQTPGVLGQRLALLPYWLSALLPFQVGTLLAQVSGFPLRFKVWAAGTLGLAALILAAYCGREAFGPPWGRFPTWGRWSPPEARRLAYAALALAALLGLGLQFYGHTGDLTLPLGGLGILGGYFYFAPPLAWYRRGLGEVLGGMFFGLLPVVTGFYLQCGHLVTEVLLYGLPLSCAGFNLLLIHGFPEPGTESEAPRASLTERLGPVAGALIYTGMNILTITGVLVCLFFPANPLPFQGGFWLMLLLAVVNQELIKRKAYRDEARLRLLCHTTLALHLGLGLMFTLSLWARL